MSLSLDDFGLAFAISLLMSNITFKERIINAGKISIAFSMSTALLPLSGWLIGLAIYEWVISFSAYVVLIVFCGVGAWMIREAFEDEKPESLIKNIPSFWILLSMGIMGSLDEGAVGVGYLFLEIPISTIIIAVVLTNTLLIHLAIFATSWIKNLNRRLPPILSGLILIILGTSKFLEIFF